jgi:hypothetical protein
VPEFSFVSVTEDDFFNPVMTILILIFSVSLSCRAVLKLFKSINTNMY